MQKNLRIVFIGSSIFSLYHLIKLIKKKYCVILIITKPKPKFSKRNKKNLSNLITKISVKYNIPVLWSESLDDIQIMLSKLVIDLIIIASYGRKLSESILNIPRFGCLNIHGSLLPRWRGAAPIQRAIYYGDCITGVTIMKINSYLDAGKIIYQKICVIKKYDNNITLCKKLAKIGSTVLIKLLKTNLFDNSVSQNNIGITYAKKLTKQEAKINWSLSNTKLVNMINAFNPWPMAFFCYQDSIIKIISAIASNYYTKKNPGTVIHYNKWGIYITTGYGIIILTSIKIISKNKNAITVNSINNNILLIASKLFTINTILV
ncbi:MAG: methionyl-tRNA formyltransferase [Candidatus Lightella neohaematopini]|nr:methionyl-tRNA formyltransferase [Candidatus Lightella neohaematopini]